MNPQARYIVFEGIDCCGKETQLFIVSKYIYGKDKKNNTIQTREPTDSKYGREAKLIQNTEKDPYASAEKCLNLYVKDRMLHIEEIKSDLEKGRIVLCDRERYSTFAYQVTQGIAPEKVVQAHSGLIMPDLALIFDITAKESIKRAKKAGRKIEKFEKLEFLEKVRQNYLRAKEFWPDHNIVIINGMQSIDDVFNEVKKHIDKVLKAPPIAQTALELGLGPLPTRHEFEQKYKVDLTRGEYDYLRVLWEKSPHSLDNEGLVLLVNPSHTIGAADVAVHRLKSKLEDTPFTISTSRGMGYCLRKKTD